MNKLIVLLSLCIATCTSALAQNEEGTVYVSTGCKKDACYHSTRYCVATMGCRHEHDKAAAKKCTATQCSHKGHVDPVDLEKAESMGKIPCSKCCKDAAKKKRKPKKIEEDED